MKRLAALISLAVILGVGVSLTSPVSGSLLHPVSAGACGSLSFQDAVYGSKSVHSSYYNENTYVRFELDKYFDGCVTYEFISWVYIQDGTPIDISKQAAARAKMTNGNFYSNTGCNYYNSSNYCAEYTVAYGVVSWDDNYVTSLATGWICCPNNASIYLQNA